MDQNPAVSQLRMMQKFFNNTISVLEEKDSGFRPVECSYSVVEQLAHTSQSIKWFTLGAFSDAGFDADFEKLEKEVREAESLEKEKQKFDDEIEVACEVWGSKSEDELHEQLPPDSIMGSIPKFAILGAMMDHTAHHRGSLAVYARLCGKKPMMPYMDS